MYFSRKKSEAKLPIFKSGLKKPVAKSPSLPKRQLSPEPAPGTRGRGASGHTLQLPEPSTQHPGARSRSLEDLNKDVTQEVNHLGERSSMRQLTYRQPAQNGVYTDHFIYLSIMPMQINISLFITPQIKLEQGYVLVFLFVEDWSVDQAFGHWFVCK